MPHRTGDILLLPFPFTDLRASKTRPAVVVSSGDYQERTGNIIVAMITSRARNSPYDHHIIEWKEANLLHPSTVRAKIATLSPRLVRFRPGRLSLRDLEAVMQILGHAIQLDDDVSSSPNAKG